MKIAKEEKEHGHQEREGTVYQNMTEAAEAEGKTHTQAETVIETETLK